MSGEDAVWWEEMLRAAALLERMAPQPGGREPAPGELALVQAFINTHFDLVDDWGADLLATPESLQNWFSLRGFAPTDGSRLTHDDLERAVAVREGLRSIAAPGGRTDGPTHEWLGALNAAAADTPLMVVLAPDGPTLVPAAEAPIARALGAILSIAYRAMIDGTWSRLKACPGDHCGWVFFDNSRNNSGRWCSMSVCGGRAKARSHYQRRRGGSD